MTLATLVKRAVLVSIVAVLAFAAGCAWQVRATRAAGVCLGQHVAIEEARGDDWSAQCGSTRYRCGYAKDLHDVTCEYQPICGNDRHQETRHGRFSR